MRRRTSAQGWTRAAIVAVMAYALILQALLLSVSGAVHAASAAEPQGIICLQGGSAAPDQTPKKAHEDLCCTLSCHGSGAAGPGPLTAVLLPALTVSLSGDKPTARPHLRPTSDVLPLGSRAPPRLG